jgi:hypothetical protein
MKNKSFKAACLLIVLLILMYSFSRLEKNRGDFAYNAQEKLFERNGRKFFLDSIGSYLVMRDVQYMPHPSFDPIDTATRNADTAAWASKYPDETKWVNLTLADIITYSANAQFFAHQLGVSLDSFRIYFGVYPTTPLIRGQLRPDYVNKATAILVALSQGHDFIVFPDTASARRRSITAQDGGGGSGLLPGNLGTICPPDCNKF